MLALLSPAKTLDFDPAPPELPHTRPVLPDATDELVAIARRQSPADLQRLMKLSEPLATLTYDRFQRFSSSRRARKGRKQAMLAFAGDVYLGLAAPTLSRAGLDFAQDHIRMLSGLYGVLRPFDLIQPYRLEMGTPLANPAGRDLYAYWGDRIRDVIRRDARRHRPAVIINLASREYAKAARLPAIGLRVVTPEFRERRNGRTAVVSVFAKRARGTMARHIVEHRITRAEGLLRFADDGYALDDGLSTDDTWVYVRDQPR